MNLNASEEKVTPYFSKKAIMIGGRTKIGRGRATRVSAVSISAWKKDFFLNSYNSATWLVRKQFCIDLKIKQCYQKNILGKKAINRLKWGVPPV